MVPKDHALRTLFHQVVEKCYSSHAGITDKEVSSYVADVLTDFCESSRMNAIRSADGRTLHDVGEMLIESDPVFGPAHSFDREREVRKHIGDYTLFFSGMFPESVNSARLRRQRLQSMLDFVRAGKQSYYVVSKFDLFEYEREAGLFRKLSQQFESCVYGLNMVRSELDRRKYILPLASENPS